MLTIKRCPTILSNYQEGSEGLGCGRNCLGQCCVRGSKLPLYTFKRRHTITAEKYADKDAEVANIPFLDSVLLGEWEERMQRGLFRYDVTTCETKVIPGNYGFIAQLNEGRHLKKRPTEFRVDKVLQDFDPSKFNFTKVGQEEVLFRFEESEENKVQYLEKALVLDSPNVIAINVSPIDYGHVLLVPRVLDCLPQRIDHDSLLLALHLAAEAGNPSFRLGYNSLGAFATINHLHFQVRLLVYLQNLTLWSMKVFLCTF
jgi:GDP-L-galactose phosphorylase